MTHWLVILLLLANSTFFFTLPGEQTFLAPSKGNASVANLGVAFRYGQDVTFSAKVSATSAIQEVLLLVTPDNQPSFIQKVELSQAGEIHQTIDANALSLRPFTTVNYHYEVALQGGQNVESGAFSFRYEDNRFKWQSQEESDFRAYWYERDAAFGQEVINTAREGLKKALSILPASNPGPISIYVYITRKDLQGGWPTTNQPWIAGYAEPDLNQVLISIPTGPEQKMELERQVPHEILHVLQYQMIGESYAKQPAWLIEGMASLAELYPNPEYQRELTAAKENQTLIPIVSLCQSIPRDVSGAYKGYAEAESFTRFLYGKYGSSGMEKLINQYKNGLGCEEGVMASFGVSLSQLEYRWKQEKLGVDPASLVFNELLPYLLLLAFVAAPVGFVLLPFATSRKRRAA